MREKSKSVTLAVYFGVSEAVFYTVLLDFNFT